MARVFITGSSSGLGLLAGRQLVGRGHQVVLHARDGAKADAIRAALPGVDAVVEGDLETLAGMRAVAEQGNALGRLDAVIHNAGVGDRGGDRPTADGLPVVFAVNVLAPYVLTALIERPDRLVYLSSSMHSGARPAHLADHRRDGRWVGRTSYSQSKFLVTALAFAVARLWPEVCSNVVNPGWVPTRMGGPSAPDNLEEGARTQAWLAEGAEPAALVTGQYLHHGRVACPDPATQDEGLQDEVLTLCERISGLALNRA
jgi:NAD(P)-dependent dehydrogenase (short-subunit alcohol dehydrogenase family)